MSLRYFLILIFFVLALTPVLFFQAWPQSTVGDSDLEDVRDRHLLLAQKIARTLEDYQANVRTTFAAFASDPLNWESASNYLKILENQNFRHICIVDRRSGQVMKSLSVAHAPCPQTIPEQRLKVLNDIAVEEQTVFSPVAAGADGSNVMHLVKPIDSNTLAVGELGTEYIRKLGEAVAFGLRGHAAIVDHAGNVLSHPLPNWVAERRSIAAVPLVQRMLAGETGVDRFFSPALRGDMVAGFTSVQPVGWGVMVPQPAEELLVKAQRARQSAMFVLLIGVAGSLTFALLLSVLMSRPLEDLTLAARRIADGELILPKTLKNKRILPLEMRDLYQSFTEMVFKLRKSITQVNRLAFLDTVTGLANRAYFCRRVTIFVDDADINETGVLLFLDLDGFKAVNDTKGHQVGDVILVQVAERLCDKLNLPLLSQKNPDETTIFESRSEALVARLGGDEFTIFLPNVSIGDAQNTAETILHSLETPFDTGESQVSLSASIGLARFPEDAVGYSSLLKAADSAMYDAKRSGKNQVQRYHRDITRRHDNRYNLADDLFSRDVAEQMDVYFQPVYRTADTSLVSVEGLLRWNHPTQGILGPGSFLSIANDLGQQRRIDMIAISKSLEIMEEFADRGIAPKELSLNLTLERLLDKPFMDEIIESMPMACKLSIELVESTTLDAMDTRVSWSIDRLKEAGIGLMLDDFGSRHASVSSLLDLAPDRIKLDSEMVSRIDNDRIAKIVKSIIDMSHDQGVKVVAKGVENIAHFTMLRDLGCDYAQGYALNAPMTKAEFMICLGNSVDAQLRSAKV